jgi:hypothetical protein
MQEGILPPTVSCPRQVRRDRPQHRVKIGPMEGHRRPPRDGRTRRFSQPYMRKNLRRFGKYGLDMDELPDPLVPKPLPFDLPL